MKIVNNSNIPEQKETSIITQNIIQKKDNEFLDMEIKSVNVCLELLKFE